MRAALLRAILCACYTANPTQGTLPWTTLGGTHRRLAATLSHEEEPKNERPVTTDDGRARDSEVARRDLEARQVRRHLLPLREARDRAHPPRPSGRPPRHEPDARGYPRTRPGSSASCRGERLH